MLSLFTGKIFSNLIFTPLNILKNCAYKNNNQNNDMLQTFENDKVKLMKTYELYRGKKVAHRSPKLILRRLNIKETDNILIFNNKVYIEDPEMTRQHKSGRPESLVKDGRRYVEYQTKENSSIVTLDSSIECSLFYNKNKIKSKNYHVSSPNISSDLHSRPLRQINSVVATTQQTTTTTTTTTFLPATNLQEITSKFASTPSNDSPVNKCDRSCNQIHTKSHKAQWSLSGLNKPLKRLNMNSTRSLPSRLKKMFSPANLSFKNLFNVISYPETFCKSCGKTKSTNDCYAWGKNGFKSPANCHLENRVNHTSEKLSTDCKIVLERIDVKFCFMYYLGLKPTVKTDEKKIKELALLNKYKIRPCHVLLSRIANKKQ